MRLVQWFDYAERMNECQDKGLRLIRPSEHGTRPKPLYCNFTEHIGASSLCQLSGLVFTKYELTHRRYLHLPLHQTQARPHYLQRPPAGVSLRKPPHT